MSNTVYIHGLLSMQVQVVFGVLFLGGLIYQVRSWILLREGRSLLYSGRRTAPTVQPAATVQVPAQKTPPNLIVCLWILSGILWFTLIANKDMRYTVPVLPAVALVSVSWLRSATRRRPSDKNGDSVGRNTPVIRRFKRVAAGLTVGLVAAWAFVSLVNAQWPRAGMGYYIDTPRFRWMVYARNYFGFDHRPLPEDWGVPEVVNTMARVASDQAPTYTPKLGVVVNLPYLNPSSVALYARLQSQGRAGSPIVTVIWLVTKSTADQISDCDYLLVRTGLDRAEWLAPLERYAEDLIKANPSRFTRIAAFPLPMEGGAEVVLYKCQKETSDSRAGNSQTGELQIAK